MAGKEDKVQLGVLHSEVHCHDRLEEEVLEEVGRVDDDQHQHCG